MRPAASGFPRTPLLKLSEKSRTPLQRSLTGHRNRFFSGRFGVRTPAKSTVETPLLPLFGQFQRNCLENPDGLHFGVSEVGKTRREAPLLPLCRTKDTQSRVSNYLSNSFSRILAE